MLLQYTSLSTFTIIDTIKPVNKGHQGKDKTLSLWTHGLYLEVFFIVLYQGRVTEVWPLFTEWYQGEGHI